MTIIHTVHSEDDNSPSITPSSTPLSSSPPTPHSSSRHPASFSSSSLLSTFYSHRLHAHHMPAHDKDSPLSAATTRSLSFARSIAVPLPPTPCSPPAFPLRSTSTPPAYPYSRRCTPALPPPRFCLLLTALLIIASLLSVSLRTLLPLLAQKEGYTLAAYISAHPLPPSLTPLPPSSDHTLSPALPPSPRSTITRPPPSPPPPSKAPSSFISRSVHLDRLAEKKRAAAALKAVEELEEERRSGGHVKSREEVREEEARRMLVRLKKVLGEGGGGDGGDAGVGMGEAGAGERASTQPDIVDVDDTLPPWSKVRLRGDQQVLALQRRPGARR